jgi:putative hydrolase of the HAD superfamily
MPIRAVLLDLFDTVVDLHMEEMPSFQMGGRTMRGTQQALHAQLSGHSELDLESFVRELAASDAEARQPLYEQGREFPTLQRFKQFLERVGLFDPTLAEQLTQTHMDQIVSQTHYLPHHVDVLRELREAVQIGICSNFSHAPTGLRILELAGLAPHCDAVVISEEVGVRKPRPEIFQALLERLDVAPHEALHVGDRLDADVRGAAEIGAIPVWITRRVADPARALAKHGGPPPAHVIEDLSELRGLVG